MKRRAFMQKSSAAMPFVLVSTGIWSCVHKPSDKKPVSFERYVSGSTLVPVIKVTPNDGFYVHTYYDVCPFSPSGKFLVVSKIPYEDKPPRYGDSAEICVIDLERETIETIYRTKCWAHQTGTMAQWGVDDNHIYTNDVIDGIGVCVVINRVTNEIKALEGPMYHVSPDGRSVIGFPLHLYDVTQRGYGLVAKDRSNPPTLPKGASAEEGIWQTNVATGEKSLLVSLKQMADHIPEPPPQNDGTFYCWHSKYSFQGDRIMVVLRCLFPDGSGGRNVNVITCRADGSEIIRTHSEPVWGHSGGHPNWHPDSRYLIRNLKPDGKDDRLCKVPVDGSDPIILSETIDGGGHPTIEPNEKFIITDIKYLDPDPVVRIRLINLHTQTEQAVCKMPTKPLYNQKGDFDELRLDGHPVWDRSFKRICFQAAPEGHRQLFVADMSSLH
tara:strand:- start:25511 stop:26830 length:1320 start_codon:yes stop_codon:yes gene_type:complete